MQQHRHYKRRYWYVQRYSRNCAKLNPGNKLYHIDIACDRRVITMHIVFFVILTRFPL